MGWTYLCCTTVVPQQPALPWISTSPTQKNKHRWGNVNHKGKQIEQYFIISKNLELQLVGIDHPKGMPSANIWDVLTSSIVAGCDYGISLVSPVAITVSASGFGRVSLMIIKASMASPKNGPKSASKLVPCWMPNITSMEQGS